MVAELPTATSPAPTEDNMNTVIKVDAELLHMEKNWAETRLGLFPEGIQAALEKPDSETEPASEQFELAADIQHITATANTTATIPTPANTATPAIYKTTTTTGTDLNNTSKIGQ
jgi:hypothetical protein